jgi:hypothetical protein
MFLRLVWIPRFEDKADETQDVTRMIGGLTPFEREFAREYLDALVA